MLGTTGGGAAADEAAGGGTGREAVEVGLNLGGGSGAATASGTLGGSVRAVELVRDGGRNGDGGRNRSVAPACGGNGGSGGTSARAAPAVVTHGVVSAAAKPTDLSDNNRDSPMRICRFSAAMAGVSITASGEKLLHTPRPG